MTGSTRSPFPTVLFIGNHLKREGFYYIFDELILRLEDKGWTTLKVSEYQLKIMRLFDMLWTIIRKRKVYSVAEVDVFSGAAFLWAELSTYFLHCLHKPSILTLHGGNLPDFARKHPFRVQRVLKLATKVVTPSTYLYHHFEKIRPDIQVIPNPIEISDYPFHQRLMPAPKLVWLRAFHEIYNPSLGPRVIHELADKWPDIKLTMVGPDKGDGSLERMLATADRLQVRERIKSPGGIPRNQVPGCLNDHDIFINTTNIDNTPISVLEALACGLCVVSTNVGGLPDLLDDGVDALLVPPDDPAAMAAAVNKILSSPSLAGALSFNARRKAEHLSWNVQFPKWEKLIQETARI